MSKTVTFVVKQTSSKKLKVVDGTTVQRLRSIVADLGYDVMGPETKVRIVRDGSAVIGHIKNEPIRSNDIVVFDNKSLRLQISPEVAESRKPYINKDMEFSSACSPDCCDARVDAIKDTIADALKHALQVIESI